MDELNKIIDRYTEGNYLISKTAKEEMAKDILALFSVSQQSELFKGFLEKVVEETYSGDLTWQTREEAKELLKLFYSTYLIYGEDILS